MELLLNTLLLIVLGMGAVFVLTLGLWAITLPFWALHQSFCTREDELKAQIAESQALLAELRTCAQPPASLRRKLPG